MRFGPVPLAEALGAILAHSAPLRGGRLRKGRVLDAADLARMAGEGWRDVVVARPDPGDVTEDRAAGRLGQALLTEGLRASEPGTGRVNLYARARGVVGIDRAAVDRLNAVHPAITLATVPQWHLVQEGAMIATVKIIAYAVPEAGLSAAEAAAAGALVLHPVAAAKVRLIQTTIGGTAGKSRAVTDRCAALGLTILAERHVPHEEAALSAALEEEAEADLILILTASATSDIADVAPAAVVSAGGTVAHYGMPVDPGNLLFVGTLGPRPVIGLPGCARSPARNGADPVLERIACGLPVTAADIMGMGVGGLLKEVPERGRPREG